MHSGRRRGLAVRGCLLAIALAAAGGALAQDAGPLGAVEFPNSGAPEAQEPFLRALAALHSFWYPEAADAFRQAQRADPGFALAYWGEALTYDHPLWDQEDLAASRAALEKLGATAAERLARAGSEREALYLDSVEPLFFGEGDREARHRAYAARLEHLARRFPDDENASALHALALQSVAGRGEEGVRTRMRSAAILEELVDRFPEHPGVLHYLIHAYDDPTHAPLGLRAARVYARVAPAAPHALHMPSHIFVQLGLWEEVAESNEDAYRASVAWVRRKRLSRDEEDLHSLSWLHYAHLQLGRVDEAVQALETAGEVAGATRSARATATRDAMAARHLLETRAWRDPLPGAPLARDPAEAPAPLALALGVAAAQQGDFDRAAAALERLRDLRGDDGGGGDGIPVLELEGLIALRRGRPEEALAALAAAAAREAALDPPSGPPYPMLPAHELYGEALLEQGRAAEAVDAFERALARTPNRRRAVDGLGRARTAQSEE